MLLVDPSTCPLALIFDVVTTPLPWSILVNFLITLFDFASIIKVFFAQIAALEGLPFETSPILIFKFSG